MAASSVEPAFAIKAFTCPHCQAHAKQFWWTTYIQELSKNEVPRIVARDQSNIDMNKVKPEMQDKVRTWAGKMAEGLPLLEEEKSDICARAVQRERIAMLQLR